MSEGICPGCGAPCPGDICCDACWKRAPSRLPGMNRGFRRALITARQVRSWREVEDIHGRLTTWLREHPGPR